MDIERGVDGTDDSRVLQRKGIELEMDETGYS